MIAKEVYERVREKVETLAGNKGLLVFEFSIFPRGGAMVLRVSADHEQGGVTLEECAACNRAVSSYLEDERVLGDDFEVEVNSPGTDMKLRTDADLRRVKGKMLSFWLTQPVEGKEYIEGILKDVDDRSFLIEGRDALPLSIIKCAKQRIDYE